MTEFCGISIHFVPHGGTSPDSLSFQPRPTVWFFSTPALLLTKCVTKYEWPNFSKTQHLICKKWS